MWARWVGEAQRFEVSAPLERFDVVLRERRMSGSAERRCWRPDGTRRSRCCGVVFWFLSCRGRVGVAPWPGSRRGVGTGRRFCWWWGSLVRFSLVGSIIRRVLSAAHRVFWLERIAFCAIGGSALSALCRSGRTAFLPFLNGPFQGAWHRAADRCVRSSGRREEERAYRLDESRSPLASRPSPPCGRRRRSDVHHESTSRANGFGIAAVGCSWYARAGLVDHDGVKVSDKRA